MLDLTTLINTKTKTVHLSSDGVTPVCSDVSMSVLIDLEETKKHKTTCKKCLKKLDFIIGLKQYNEDRADFYASKFESFDEQKHSF